MNARKKLSLLMLDQHRRRRRKHGGGASTPTVAAGPTYLIYDTFTRADGPIGNAEIGGAWTDASAVFTVSSNTCTAPTASGTKVATIDDGETQGTFELTYTAAGNFGLCIRKQAAQATFIGTRVASGLIRLIRDTNGSISTIGTGGAAIAGDTVKVVLVGNVYSVYLNDVWQFDATDSQGSSNTVHGIFTLNAVIQVDDVSHAAP